MTKKTKLIKKSFVTVNCFSFRKKVLSYVTCTMAIINILYSLVKKKKLLRCWSWNRFFIKSNEKKVLLICFLFCFSDFRSYPSPNLPRISKTSSGDLVRSSSGSRFRGSLGGKSKPKKCKAKCKPWKKVLCELVCRILYWNARSGLVHQMNMDITWHASDYNLSLQKCYTSLYGVLK